MRATTVEVLMRVSYEDSIKGRTVIDASGAGIGEVVGLSVELDEGGRGLAIAGIGVKLRSEVSDALGLPRGTFHAAVVQIPASALQAISDAVLLSATIASLVHPSAAEAPSAP
jgi:sporulation protein YlmC with PRC-barrel domain